MKIECSIEKFKTAVGISERSVGRNLTLPILNSILILASGNTVKLRSTNLSIGVEIEIPAKILKEGVCAVKGDVLQGIFLNINQTDTVILENVNDNLLINTKNNSIVLKTASTDDFPILPTVDGKSFEI